jgi:hypothetical protein
MIEEFKSFFEPEEVSDSEIMSRIDITIDPSEIYMETTPPSAILDRISLMACQLLPHEEFTSLLGVATVRIDALPNATRVSIFPNDKGVENTSLFITFAASSFDRRRHIHAALSRYLLPMLED